MDGGAPNLVVTLNRLSDYTFGELVYFFWKSLAISGYMIGVNPFDQPGVEAYKKNMFALLGKPGFGLFAPLLSFPLLSPLYSLFFIFFHLFPALSRNLCHAIGGLDNGS